MRRLGYRTFGGPEVLSWSDVSEPLPGSKEVVVQTRASSVNPNDIQFRNGVFRARTAGLAKPYGMGLDVAGDVVSVGAAVTRFAIGDRVVGRTKNGDGFADASIVRERDLVVLPASIDYPEAAALALSGGTAVGVADSVRLPTGSRVFVSGGSGGIGSVLIALLIRRGFVVEASASARSAARLRMLGVARAHDHRQLDVAAAHTFDAAIDVTGNLDAAAVSMLLRNRGHLYALVPAPNLVIPVVRGLSRWPGSPAVHIPLITATADRIGHALLLAASNKLSAKPDTTYPLEEAITALTSYEADRPLGKTVLVVKC